MKSIRPSKSRNTVHVLSMSTNATQTPSLSEFETPLRPVTLDQLPDLHTINELSIWARVPVNTFYEWKARGTGPTPFKMGKHPRYSKERVRAWKRELEAAAA